MTHIELNCNGLNSFVFYESKTGKYLGYKTSEGNIAYKQ
jgi:hypothetical protein